MSSASQRPDRLDLDVVACQLGRPGAGSLHPVARIAARCPWQLPAVVESPPYDHAGRPFPTLFYLTCPTAVAAVARVEAPGWSAEFALALQSRIGLRESVVTGERYERRRRRALAAGPAAGGAGRALDGGAALETGIGGSPCVARQAGRGSGRRSPEAGRSPDAATATALKCLHAHAAHALARPGYAFGDLVLEQAREAAGSLWCAEARCARDCLPPRPEREAEATSRGPGAAAGAVRVAVVDLGTNTCRLLLGAIGPAWCGPIALDERRTTVVRLGQGVDRSGRLAGPAIERTRACLADYAALIDAYGPDARRLNATSVLRDAADGREFLAAVERDFRLPWRVLSGDEEAAAAFRGAMCGPAGRAMQAASRGRGAVEPAAFSGGSPGVAGKEAAPDTDAPRRSDRTRVLVVDIGGGSTELIVGPVPDGAGRASGHGPAPTFAVSMDVGAVRLTERCFHHDPPTEREWGAAVRWVRALLRREAPPGLPDRVGGGMGVAGTISTLVANKLGLREFRSELVDGQPLHLWEIERAISGFRRLTSAQRGKLPGIQPGREDVILAGALIAREVCRAFGLPGLRCGESDILEGAALQLADEARGAW